MRDETVFASPTNANWTYWLDFVEKEVVHYMKRLAIIAGKGHLPIDVAAAAKAKGYDILMLPIEGQADADFSKYKVSQIRLGGIGKTRSIIMQQGIDQLVMVGKVVWPSIGALRPDFDGAKLLGKMMTRGDDNVLRLVAAYFSEKGIETLAPNHFLPNRKMPLGVVHNSGSVDQGAISAEANRAITYGAAVLESLGKHDVGQSVVLQNGRIIAIEAAEGSDEMIARSASLLDPNGGIACFVKMAKSTQDLRLDVPVFGGDTIRLASMAGVSLLAIEANTVMLADDLSSIQSFCTTYGITLVGIERQSLS